MITAIPRSPNPIVKNEKFPIKPATTGFLKYNTEAVKIAIAINSTPTIKPTNPIILSKFQLL